MGELFAVLFFSRAVADIRRLYEERYLVQRCLDVARECLKYDDPLLVLLQFSNSVASELPRMSDEGIAYHVRRCSETLDRTAVARIAQTAAELTEISGKQLNDQAESDSTVEDDQILIELEGEKSPVQEVVKSAPAELPTPTSEEATARVGAVAVADLEMAAELKKQLIGAGLNTVSDIQRFHAEKGVTSLERISERKAELIFASIRKLG
ncbi:hypothetical protein VN12_26375 [Pirellula sp. SH-Sr6A]|uniref:hypothetical protein n=1 Tax=Pirellula sp. SH-Sr6A TaxID=1632865 RepID=UPI00078E91F9|nr:hypothetical protein [Pirellula sp. SH-Sr6A]AMV35646.1 hypothetical protein VN12_26375 [Pirellula sp. SH-Sr6A]